MLLIGINPLAWYIILTKQKKNYEYIITKKEENRKERKILLIEINLLALYIILTDKRKQKIKIK